MKLIVITPSKDAEDEHELITKMFESGLTTLHLRKPKYSTREMCDYIEQIPEAFRNRIVLHSHHKLVFKYGLKGIHLSRIHFSKKLRYWYVRVRLKVRFSETSKSRSYMRLKQVYEKEEQNFSYFFLGTMFNSLTGDFYGGFYEDGVIAANKNGGKKLIARGGNSPKTIETAAKCGFYGMAFGSYIWDAEKPFENFLQVLAEFKKHNITLE
ncbi:MAG: thiamine phosphate synthase [Bacteroidetes bacterium]|nr:thiamine phosphate synthase [Bacteroidota bacterium]